MKKISLVLPVYNEGKRIKSTIAKLKKGVDFSPYGLEEIIFVNDGSQDNTLKILKEEKKSLEKILKTTVQVFSYPENKGRGYAVQLGALNASGDYIIYTDADFSIPLSNFKNFKKYLDQNYDLIFGSKKKPGAEALIKRSLARKITGLGHTILASIIFGVFAWDYQGGFKIFSRKLVNEVFPILAIDRWGFDMEVVFLSKKLNYKSKEVAVKWSHVENGSTVKLIRDSLRFIPEILRIEINWLTRKYFPKLLPQYSKELAYQLY